MLRRIKIPTSNHSWGPMSRSHNWHKNENKHTWTRYENKKLRRPLPYFNLSQGGIYIMWYICERVLIGSLVTLFMSHKVHCLCLVCSPVSKVLSNLHISQWSNKFLQKGELHTTPLFPFFLPEISGHILPYSTASLGQRRRTIYWV